MIFLRELFASRTIVNVQATPLFLSTLLLYPISQLIQPNENDTEDGNTFPLPFSGGYDVPDIVQRAYVRGSIEVDATWEGGTSAFLSIFRSTIQEMAYQPVTRSWRSVWLYLWLHPIQRKWQTYVSSYLFAANWQRSFRLYRHPSQEFRSLAVNLFSWLAEYEIDVE